MKKYAGIAKMLETVQNIGISKVFFILLLVYNFSLRQASIFFMKLYNIKALLNRANC